jgi:hypothetical protein
VIFKKIKKNDILLQFVLTICVRVKGVVAISGFGPTSDGLIVCAIFGVKIRVYNFEFFIYVFICIKAGLYNFEICTFVNDGKHRLNNHANGNAINNLIGIKRRIKDEIP